MDYLANYEFVRGNFKIYTYIVYTRFILGTMPKKKNWKQSLEEIYHANIN